jgi:hypothetical protein
MPDYSRETPSRHEPRQAPPSANGIGRPLLYSAKLKSKTNEIEQVYCPDAVAMSPAFQFKASTLDVPLLFSVRAVQWPSDFRSKLVTGPPGRV